MQVREELLFELDEVLVIEHINLVILVRLWKNIERTLGIYCRHHRGRHNRVVEPTHFGLVLLEDEQQVSRFDLCILEVALHLYLLHVTEFGLPTEPEVDRLVSLLEHFVLVLLYLVEDTHLLLELAFVRLVLLLVVLDYLAHVLELVLIILNLVLFHHGILLLALLHQNHGILLKLRCNFLL